MIYKPNQRLKAIKNGTPPQFNSYLPYTIVKGEEYEVEAIGREKVKIKGRFRNKAGRTAIASNYVYKSICDRLLVEAESTVLAAG